MLHTNFGRLAVAAVLIATPAVADVTVDYTIDAGGDNPNGPSGLMASALFSLDGTSLTIKLTNTSIGAPMDAEVSDSLLVSLGFNLPGGVSILSGDDVVLGAGSMGLGAWSAFGEGDSLVGEEEWLWTNDFGGDLMEAFAQIISTSSGQGGGDSFLFGTGGDPGVNGPFGGIAADPPILAVPGSQMAVSNMLVYSLTLSDAISESQLEAIAASSIVEFGSDFQYMTTPAPGALALFGLALFAPRRRRA